MNGVQKIKKASQYISNVVDCLKIVSDKSPGLGTVTRWAERPEMENDVEKRAMPGQKLALYFLLRAYCEEKRIRKSPLELAKLLNGLALSKGYGSELSFNKEEVSAWLKRPR